MFDFREFPAQILMQQEWLSLLYPSCQRTIINYCTERHCDWISIEFHFLLDAFLASGSDLCANERTHTRSNVTLFSWNDIGFALNASSFFSTLQPVCKCFHLHSANRIFFGKHEIFCIMASFSFAFSLHGFGWFEYCCYCSCCGFFSPH